MRPVDRAIFRFPDQGEAIRRLYLSDEHFRAICEDIELATTTLQRFNARADKSERPEIEEYHTVLSELEKELQDYIARYGTP